MARTGVLDSDPAVMAKATELKKELRRLVKAIVDDDDYAADTFRQAQETLLALKELNIRKTPTSVKLNDTLSCPEEFKCPLSKEMMRDPVIVSSGQTYDRPFIQRWLKAGNRTCPKTQQVLTHTILTPNQLVREMILQWCKSRGIELLDSIHYVNEDGMTDADRDHFLSLLKKMSSTVPEQKAAAKEIRTLTKKMPMFRGLFGELPEAIPQLLSPLTIQGKSWRDVDPNLQEDVVTILLNSSINDSNKKIVAENPLVIPLLIDAMRWGTIETRSNAAAALFTLSAIDSNKTLIGKSGAMKPLIDLLEEGHPLALKDVASAIFNLCIVHENKARAVRDGAVRVILKKIRERAHVDELLAILAILSSHHKAMEELEDLEAVPCLLSLMRETNCERNKENCISILHTICLYDRTKLKEIREEENVHGTVSDVAKNGTLRARRKASGILERMNRVVNITHTA